MRGRGKRRWRGKKRWRKRRRSGDFGATGVPCRYGRERRVDELRCASAVLSGTRLRYGVGGDATVRAAGGGVRVARLECERALLGVRSWRVHTTYAVQLCVLACVTVQRRSPSPCRAACPRRTAHEPP